MRVGSRDNPSPAGRKRHKPPPMDAYHKAELNGGRKAGGAGLGCHAGQHSTCERAGPTEATTAARTCVCTVCVADIIGTERMGIDPQEPGC